MPEVRINKSRVTLKEFKHPDGSLGIMAGLRFREAELADAFDISGDHGDETIVVPLRHNTDRRTDFEDYHYEGDDIVFEMTDEQFTELSRFFRGKL